MSERKIAIMEENMVYSTINIIILLCLAYATYTDIKSHSISIKVSLSATILIIITLFFSDRPYLSSIIYGLIPGIVLFILSYLTRESIGYGDGVIVSIIGIGLGFSKVIFICIIAFIVTAIVAIFLIIKRKSGKSTLPFVPFILCGFILELCLF